VDFKIRITFDDGNYRLIHVDDVIKVEAPWDAPDQDGWVLLDCEGEQISGCISPLEIRKVKYYKPDVIRSTAFVVIALRAARRKAGACE
jgi:hypothetical protein